MSQHDTHFQRALNRIVRKAIATPGEMSDVIGCTPQHISGVARGDHHLSPKKKEVLSSWLVDERGVTDQVQGMLGLSGATHFHPDEADHDDCLQDEIYEARSLAGDADRLMKEGKEQEAKRKMAEAIGWMQAAMADIES